MKVYGPKPNRRARHARVPAFLPVPLRGRADGWTVERQARFLVALAASGSVAAAARKAGMARETAYRLRRRPGAESFAAAWDHIVGHGAPRRKVTPGEWMRRALDQLVKPIAWRSELTCLIQKPDNSALLRVLRQLDRSIARDA